MIKKVEIDREIERIEASIEMLSFLDFVLLLQIFNKFNFSFSRVFLVEEDFLYSIRIFSGG